MFKRFMRDPYFLLKYYLAHFLVLGVCSLALQCALNRVANFPLFGLWLGGLALFVLPSFSLIYLSSLYFIALLLCATGACCSSLALLLAPAGLLCGTFSAAIMHNAAHGNLYPKWSNFLWGELCGLFQVSGFAGWCVAHLLHHGHPDDPDRDPHPPGKLTFTQFADSMGKMMRDIVTKKYFEAQGRTPKTLRIWSLVSFLLPVNRFLRVLLVLLALGPLGFVFFYIPFKLANALIYADFNYRTHRPSAGGGYEILNLNGSWWYKFLNAISFGSYFHKNHHRKPRVFDPRYVAPENAPWSS